MKIRNDFLPLARPSMSQEEINAVIAVIQSGHLTTGPKVTEFEQAFTEYIGEPLSSVALNSCTAGLYLALLAYGIKQGDEVIVPTWTFAATGHVVLWTGAKPVLCDVQDSTLNMGVKQLESLITPRTKAIIPVHFAGFPCDMDTIMRFAKKHNLKIIEDAAHACGTRYNGRKIGCHGDVVVFSFYATKNLACGEGGMAVSHDAAIIEIIRKLSYFGINKEALNRYTPKGSWYYEIESLGYKYNMDSIHAAIASQQLKKLDAMNERRRAIAGIYRLTLSAGIRLPWDEDNAYHCYHLFPIRINKKIISRDKFIERLKEVKIGSSVHFIPLHKHSFYQRLCAGNFPVSDNAYEEILSIPMFPSMTDDDALYVCQHVNKIVASGG